MLTLDPFEISSDVPPEPYGRQGSSIGSFGLSEGLFTLAVSGQLGEVFAKSVCGLEGTTQREPEMKPRFP